MNKEAFRDTVKIGRKVRVNGKSKYTLFNHWIFTIRTQPVENSDQVYIVGFDVEPRSYAPGEMVLTKYEVHEPLYLDDLKGKGRDGEFSFTYTIQTIHDSNTEWAHRMDHYFKTGNQYKHDLTLTAGILIIFALSLLLACMLRRGIHSDFDAWVTARIS